jgi:hypothetical protein
MSNVVRDPTLERYKLSHLKKKNFETRFFTL